MKRLLVAMIVLMGGIVAMAGDDDTMNVDPETVKAAYARLAAAQKGTAATQPTDSEAEIRKLKQEVYQLQDQVLALKAENAQLRQRLGLGVAAAPGKGRTDFEQRIKAFALSQGWNEATTRNGMADAAKVDEALNAWCDANSPDQDTADALWAGKLAVGLPWGAVSLIGRATLLSEATDAQVYQFVPEDTAYHRDEIRVEDGKVAEIIYDVGK